MKVSELISELQAHKRKYGDVEVYGKYDDRLEFFTFGKVEPQSLTQHHAVLPLRHIAPQTPCYAKFVERINKKTRQPLWRRLVYGAPNA